MNPMDETITRALTNDEAHHLIDGDDDDIASEFVELLSEAVNRADATQKPAMLLFIINP
jgi:hypothetical protein